MSAAVADNPFAPAAKVALPAISGGTYTDSDGTAVVLSLTGGGSGSVVAVDGGMRLELDGTSTRSTLTVTATGGDGATALRDVWVNGSLKAIKAAALDVTGSLAVTGKVGTLALRNVSGATVAAEGLRTVKIGGALTGATVLAGVDLGTDHQLGGAGDAADRAIPATVSKFSVAGAMSSSFVGVGLDPVDGVLGNGNDKPAGGTGGKVGGIVVGGPVDAASRIVVGRLPKTAKFAGARVLTTGTATFFSDAQLALAARIHLFPPLAGVTAADVVDGTAIAPAGGFDASPPTAGGRAVHRGIDLQRAGATTVVAAKDGAVVFNGVLRGYGNTVLLQHGDGTVPDQFFTQYSFLQKKPKLSAEVKAGDVIGVAGKDAEPGVDASVPALHFEVVLPDRAGRYSTDAPRISPQPRMSNAEVRVTPTAPNVAVGAAVRVTAALLDPEGNPLPLAAGDLTWTTASGGVATVVPDPADPAGAIVTGLAVGRSTVIATDARLGLLGNTVVVVGPLKVRADSVADFSGVQGQGGWFYGYEQAGTFGLLTQYTAGVWTEQEGAGGYWTSLRSDGGHPNGVNGNADRLPVEQLAVRRWVSPTAATVTIDGTFGPADSGRTAVRVVVDGVTAYTGDTNAPTSYSVVATLHAGSTVDFVIDPAGSDVNDSTVLTGVIQAAL